MEAIKIVFLTEVISHLITKIEFSNRRKHINGIENLWGLAKARLAKFRGIHNRTFYLHLKEWEFKFNHRHENLYRLLMKIIKNSLVKK